MAGITSFMTMAYILAVNPSILAAAGMAQGALLADSVATTSGAVLGTSTVTLLLSPIFLAIPSFATAPALIIVGFYMIGAVSEIDFKDPANGISAFICIFAMPFFYSISEGISMGVISYVVLSLISGKKKKISPVMIVLAVLFILKYIFM